MSKGQYWARSDKKYSSMCKKQAMDSSFERYIADIGEPLSPMEKKAGKMSFEGTFFRFWQNNAGGFSKIDASTGLGDMVYVEANTPEEADAVLESAGADFDDGCECCGSRWYRAGYSDQMDDLVVAPVTNTAVITREEVIWFS